MYKHMHRLVKMCLDIASLAEEEKDEKRVGWLACGLGTGSNIIGLVMRAGIRDIVALEDELARTKSHMDILEADRETLRAFRTTFGCDDPGDFSDDALEQIQALIKKIWEEEEQ